MKCSLLTLSTYIDGELVADRRAELDAHLVGCARCSTGAATLREEKTRLGQLARVRVAPPSVRLMLEQVGITGLADMPTTARPAAPMPSAPAEQQPWLVAQRSAAPSGAALPWTPRRPAPPPPIANALPAPPVAPDVQPELPLAGVPIEQRSDYPWVEADVPPDVGDTRREHELLEKAHDVASAPLPVPPAMPVPMPVPMPPPLAAMAPTRAPSPGGSKLWSRVRDAVAVRLTLARRDDTVEESIQIVSGATPPRGRQLPPTQVVEPVADLAASGAVETEVDAADVELTGLSGVVRAAPLRQPTEALVRTQGSPPPAAPPDQRIVPPPAEPVAWNAFGASSYPCDPAAAVPPAAAPVRPISPGRHSRAVARTQVDVGTRMRRAAAGSATRLREGGEAAAAATRTMLATVKGADPDRRMIAAIAAVAIIFISALVIGHRSTPSSSPTAGPATARSAPAHASTAPRPPTVTAAPATSAAAAIGTPAPLAFGAGGSGFQVRDLRYGQQSSFLRIVFDMGPVSGSTGSSPKVTVAFTSPTVLLATFNGTLPAGSTGAPPKAGVISSVTLVSSSGGKTVYRIVTTRAVTASGLFLSGTSPPLRFVLDLH